VVQDEIDRIARDLKRMQVEFERFFNGALPTPPEELRERLQRRLRQLQPRLFADRFRLNGLETRFNSLNEMINRRIRDQERAAPKIRSVPQVNRSTGKRPAGSDIEIRVAEKLYKELYAGEKGSKPDEATFRDYLSTQTARIQDQTGCDRVEFRVIADGGVPRLRARPVVTKNQE
jgi:hypothetical protein